MLWWSQQVPNCAKQQWALSVHQSWQSQLQGFPTALQSYHRRALKHCLPLKHNQCFERLKDQHRDILSLYFSLSFISRFSENYTRLQARDFFTFNEQGMRRLGNNVRCNFSVHQRKSCQDTSVMLKHRELIMPLTWGWISVIFSGCQSFCLLLWWLEEWMAFCNAKRSWPSLLGICNKILNTRFLIYS